MSQLILSAIFSRPPDRGDATRAAEISERVASRLVGRPSVLKIRGGAIDECQEYLFGPFGSYFATIPWPWRKSRGAAINVADARVIVISERCGDWLAPPLPRDFLDICGDLRSEKAIVLYSDDSVGSGKYLLWEEGKIVRTYGSRDMGTRYGAAPELEDRLRLQYGDFVCAIVDEMAAPFLGVPFSQLAYETPFDLWVPA